MSTVKQTRTVAREAVRVLYYGELLTVAVLTFVAHIKYYLNTMKNKLNDQRGEMDFLVMILMFLVVLFVIWMLTGGAQKSDSTKPFINPYNDSSAPLKVYGPGEGRN